MSRGDNTPGVSRLAGVVKKMIADGSNNIVLDFGTILPGGSLMTNLYPVAIPPRDYLICRCAALPSQEIVTSEKHTHNVGGGGDVSITVEPGGEPEHTHAASGSAGTPSIQSATVNVNIARPSQAAVKPGDRVLVAWVGNDAVVVDVIVGASQVFGGGGIATGGGQVG